MKPLTITIFINLRAILVFVTGAILLGIFAVLVQAACPHPVGRTLFALVYAMSSYFYFVLGRDRNLVLNVRKPAETRMSGVNYSFPSTTTRFPGSRLN